MKKKVVAVKYQLGGKVRKDIERKADSLMRESTRKAELARKAATAKGSTSAQVKKARALSESGNRDFKHAQALRAIKKNGGKMGKCRGGC